MTVERLVIDGSEPQVPDYEAPDQVRETAEGEVSIAAWTDGDPVRAAIKADEFAEERLSLLMQQRLNEHIYREKLAKLDRWMQAEEERIAKRVDWIDNLLEVYAHDFHPDEKTVRLPNAELKRRKNRSRVEWSEDAALHYQQERYPEDVTQKLSKSALKDRLVERDGRFYDAETGEELEFVRKAPPEEPETFSVVQEVPDGD